MRVSLTAICGSDLHLYNGLIPSMLDGDIRFEERLEMARAHPGVTVVNYEEVSVYDRLMEVTG